MKFSRGFTARKSRWIRAAEESVCYALSQVEWFPSDSRAKIHNAFGMGGTLFVYSREELESYFCDLAMAAYCVESLNEVGEIICDYDEAKLVAAAMVVYKEQMDLVFPKGRDDHGERPV